MKSILATGRPGVVLTMDERVKVTLLIWRGLSATRDPYHCICGCTCSFANPCRCGSHCRAPRVEKGS